MSLPSPREKPTTPVVFLAIATGQPKAADDAKNLGIFSLWEIPQPLCFDYEQIIADYRLYRDYGIRPRLFP